MTLHKFFDYLAGFLILFLVMVIAFLVYVKDRNINTEKDTVSDISTEQNDLPFDNSLGFGPYPTEYVLGDKENLEMFSVAPNTEFKTGTKIEAFGTIKGGYFFEGNILVNILDSNKIILKAGHGTAISDWMTVGSVTFNTTIDFAGIPSGEAYIEIHNDNASGEPENDKSILIPIFISE